MYFDPLLPLNIPVHELHSVSKSVCEFGVRFPVRQSDSEAAPLRFLALQFTRIRGLLTLIHLSVGLSGRSQKGTDTMMSFHQSASLPQLSAGLSQLS